MEELGISPSGSSSPDDATSIDPEAARALRAGQGCQWFNKLAPPWHRAQAVTTVQCRCLRLTYYVQVVVEPRPILLVVYATTVLLVVCPTVESMY